MRKYELKVIAQDNQSYFKTFDASSLENASNQVDTTLNRYDGLWFRTYVHGDRLLVQDRWRQIKVPRAEIKLIIVEEEDI
jgi:hypothetical protein